MSDYELLQCIVKKAGIPIGWHVGDKDCPKCRGRGFVPTPLWRKVKAVLFERVPWKFIRPEIECLACEGDTVWRYRVVGLCTSF